MYPPIFKATLTYSAALILIETYNKILKAQEKMRKKEPGAPKKTEKKKKTIFQLLAYCCRDGLTQDDDVIFTAIL